MLRPTSIIILFTIFTVIPRNITPCLYSRESATSLHKLYKCLIARMSSNFSQPSKPPKISQEAFQVSAGFLLGIAVMVAGGRISARFYKSHGVTVDDGFFFLAITTFISGTTVLYLDLPYIYLQENVEARLRAAPADLVSQLIHSEKLQDTATTLLGTTIISVKFSFLFFFRDLLRQQKRMLAWWWCIFVFLIPTAPILMFSNLISCSYFDERILVECVTPVALARQNGTLRATATVDIVSDALLISIPVILLWNVKINLRRKLALWGILCLSIFTAITAVIKVAGGNISHDQVDSAWAIFWLQAEAAVAIIVVSITAFRALFVAHRTSKQQSPAHHASTSRSIWSRIVRRDEDLPAALAPTFTGARTYIRYSPYGSGSFKGSRDMELPLQGPGIRVTHDISSDKTNQHGAPKPSAESFV